MSVTASGADILANTLVQNLTQGKNFLLPGVDLSGDLFQQPPASGDAYGTVKALTTEELTMRTVDGSGVFDALMASVSAHLKNEFDSNRISGAEYTKTYTGALQAALQMSVQFLLGRDQAYWQALLLQRQAKAAEAEIVKTRVELETVKMALVAAEYTAVTAEANYALTKLKVATEDQQVANLAAQGETLAFTNQYILPLQKSLLGEQVEATRAQTQDIRTDGNTVTGTLGKQKDLYSQQITSYQRDAENKFVKLFTDAWITQKTLDDGLLAPSNFQNANIDTILTNIRAKLNV